MAEGAGAAERTLPRQGAHVGIVGLGVMGANLARNFIDHGLHVAGYDREWSRAEELQEGCSAGVFSAADRLESLVTLLIRPRRILLLVPAGPVVDDVVEQLDPLLGKGDFIVDAGNSHYLDTERRIERAMTRPWEFIGMGVSGGPQGARHGCSIMAGGTPEQWEQLRPLLVRVAARSPSGVCVTHCGRRAAGHFVKLVHNAIEYGEMQLISEAALILSGGLGHSAERVAELFESWNRSELQGYLLEISARILRTPDPEAPEAPLLDAILDRAGQSGTGLWAVKAALELGVAVPTIAAAVDARTLSCDLQVRRRARQIFEGRVEAMVGASLIDDVQQALLAARIANLSQGFELLRSARDVWHLGTELPEIARIWKGGCILRSRLLDVIEPVLRTSDLPIALGPDPSERIRTRLPAWRRIVATASLAKLPIPGFSSALQWLDTLSTARGSAALVQAQRDFFGQHGYERVGRPGERLHMDWEAQDG